MFRFTQVLDSFLNYRLDKMRSATSNNDPWKYTDNVQLIYGGDFDGDTIGMASVGTMCSTRSGGVDQVRNQMVVFHMIGILILYKDLYVAVRDFNAYIRFIIQFRLMVPFKGSL